MYKIIANFILGGKEYKTGEQVEESIFNSPALARYYISNGSIEEVTTSKVEPIKPVENKPKKKTK